MEAKEVFNNPEVKEILYHAYQIGSSGQEYLLSRSDKDRLMEISFEAGEDKGKQEGIKEVVKWLRKHGFGAAAGVIERENGGKPSSKRG